MSWIGEVFFEFFLNRKIALIPLYFALGAPVSNELFESRTSFRDVFVGDQKLRDVVLYIVLFLNKVRG